MSLWQSIVGRFSAGDPVAPTVRDGADDFWFGAPSGEMRRLWPATPETARAVPVVDNCVSILAQTIAALPGGMFERGADGSRRPAPEHPLADVLAGNPNAEQTGFEFGGTMQDDLSLRGNALAEIVPGARGAVDQLVRIEPERLVRCYRDGNGVRWYEVRRDANGVRKLRFDEVLHLRALPLVGDFGMSPVRRASATISAARALQDYAARFFDNDTQSGGIITAEHSFENDEAKTAFLKRWREARSGENRHRDALLEFGMKYQVITPNNEQAQFLQTRKEQNLELARYWNMPPHKVGILDNATFSNIEHQALEFVIDTLLPWIELWEQKINKELVLNPRRFFFEFNLDGLLRGDTKARYESWKIAREGGWLNVNEIRRMDNRNPVPGGETYMQPLNMGPVGGGQVRTENAVGAVDPQGNENENS